MRTMKIALPVAVFVLIAVIGVGASLAQTETPTAPTTSDSTESPAATPNATPGQRGFGMGGNRMMQGSMMGGAMMDVINAGLQAVAQQTGMTTDEIIAAVRGGQTVADLVKSKNGDLQAVIDATVKAATDKVTAAVAAGTLTQAQADKLTANLTQAVTDALNGKLPPMMMAGIVNPNGPMGGRPNGPMGGRPGMGGFGPWNGPQRGPMGGWGMNRGGMGMGENDVLFAALSSATKLNQRDLLRALRGGKTLADVITANGSTVDAVVNSAVAAETDFINGHVELGQISREDADKRIAGLKDRFTQILNMSMMRRGNHGMNPMATPEATADATQAVSA